MVKPVAEGSSKGIQNNSVVKTKEELYERIANIIETYNQPALAEEFLTGREFTVAVIGNENPICLPIVEINLDELPAEANKIYSYEAKYLWDTPEKPLKMFTCPAKVPKELKVAIIKNVIEAYKATNCRDWARIDVRLDAKGIPSIIEINPLPGIMPKPEDNSCFPAAARAAGFSYDETVNLPLLFALKRAKLFESNREEYFEKLLKKIEQYKKNECINSG
jgi:D-alanine-D-alanine ligase